MELVRCGMQDKARKGEEIQNMKRIILALAIFLLVAGCTPTLKSSSGIPIKAIYLVQGVGQLSQEDLQAHPEVMVTDSFDEFKKLAESKVALWIDINSVGLVDIGWLGSKPQLFYPVAVVGNGNDFCAFFWNMLYFSFEVPPPEEEGYCDKPYPGFSVNIQKDENGGSSHGYDVTPTVQGILDVTNPLLEGVK